MEKKEILDNQKSDPRPVGRWIIYIDKCTGCGGSGCGCCGSVFSGYFFKQLKAKKLKKVLLIATGALMNSTSSQQGESIPGIAHAISIEI